MISEKMNIIYKMPCVFSRCSMLSATYATTDVNKNQMVTKKRVPKTL